MNRNGNKSSWRVRRRFMLVISAFCMFIIFYILYKEINTTPAEAAMTMAFMCLISIISSYVFGATWEDITTRKTNADFIKKGD